MNRAAEQWAGELGEWAIPEDILRNAPSVPFVFPPEMFAAPPVGTVSPSLSTRLAAEVVADGGSVLDIGSGGGAAAFALAPPATLLIGTDRQQGMMDLFAETAAERMIACETYTGSWPDVADDVPVADVAISHNVLYNIPNVVEFAMAAQDHARRRVVLELTEVHPQTVRAPLWKHFWDVDRPTGPTASVALAALREAGIPARSATTLATPRGESHADDVEAQFWCRQLCLPAERLDEVAELVATIQFPKDRVTIWWNVG